VVHSIRFRFLYFNAILLPDGIPGYKNTDVKLLPSHTTEHAIWELYLNSTASDILKSVVYSTFTQLWHQLLPNVLVMKPISDLCWICQRNKTAIMRAVNKAEEAKSAVYKFRKLSSKN